MGNTNTAETGTPIQVTKFCTKASTKLSLNLGWREYLPEFNKLKMG